MLERFHLSFVFCDQNSYTVSRLSKLFRLKCGRYMYRYSFCTIAVADLLQSTAAQFLPSQNVDDQMKCLRINPGYAVVYTLQH